MISQNETVPEEIYQCAVVIYEIMTQWSEGLGPLDRIKTLLHLAKKMGCVIEVGANCVSSYCPNPDSYSVSGAIAIDATEPHIIQVRNMAHEIGHHVFFFRDAFLRHRLEMPGVEVSDTRVFDGLEKYGTLEHVEEVICRIVEDLVFTLPSGIQRDGKLAPPRGDGTVKWHRRIDTRVPSQQMSISEIDRLLAEIDD